MTNTTDAVDGVMVIFFGQGPHDASVNRRTRPETLTLPSHIAGRFFREVLRTSLDFDLCKLG